MTITIPREVVRQACVAFTTPYGGKWIEHDIEVTIGEDTHLVSVRLEVQNEAFFSKEAETARAIHAQIQAATTALGELQSLVSRGTA